MPSEWPMIDCVGQFYDEICNFITIRGKKVEIT